MQHRVANNVVNNLRFTAWFKVCNIERSELHPLNQAVKRLS